MKITDIFGLLGGLALFLYGMQMMSAGLETAAGNRMKQILEKLTASRFLGVLVGAAITAVIQSSSATTVMVVGFVNSRMMTLTQAVWIIMGANIGTTVTGLLIALDVGVLAPLIAFAGVVLIVFFKNPKLHPIGQIMAGLGVLFIGMDMMSAAMVPLRDSQAFISLMTRFSNPLLGILAGAVFTAIIQSSSASVGTLQTLAASELIGLPSAVYVLFGQNIGTCITAVLASIGTSRNAKRTTVIHLMFNLFGTALFTLLCQTTPLTGFLQSLAPASPSAQIALTHTMFNIVTTMVLLPFGNWMVKAAIRILPDSKKEKELLPHLKYITQSDPSSDRHIGSSAIHLTQLEMELGRMLSMAQENVRAAFHAVLQRDDSSAGKVTEREDYLDYLNKEISQFISRIIVLETNEGASAAISAYFKISGDIERIGDHALNIFGYTSWMKEKDIRFSDEAQEEIEKMCSLCMDVLDSLQDHTAKKLSRIAQLEQKNDDMTARFRQNQMDRIRKGSCSEEGCVLYSEMLTDFERIGDHALNISQSLYTAAQGFGEIV